MPLVGDQKIGASVYLEVLRTEYLNLETDRHYTNSWYPNPIEKGLGHREKQLRECFSIILFLAEEKGGDPSSPPSYFC